MMLIFAKMDKKIPQPTRIIERGRGVTNKQKSQLRQLVKEGLSFKEIRRIVDCSDATIKSYIKTFTPNPNEVKCG